MRSRKPLITAVVLSLALTGPAMVSAKDKKPNQNQGRQGNGNQGQNNGNGHGGNGNGGGEDLTHMRFAGLDTNHDGQITRDEWRGNDNSFNQHDWNGDGVLSGIEVTPGTQRPGGDDNDDDDDSDDDGGRFNSLDRDRDGRISLSEWRGQRDAFERMDVNHDKFLSRDELAVGGNDHWARAFRALDVNRDLRLSQTEWQGDPAQFVRLDRNGDRFLSWTEFSRRR